MRKNDSDSRKKKLEDIVEDNLNAFDRLHELIWEAGNRLQSRSIRDRHGSSEGDESGSQ